MYITYKTVCVGKSLEISSHVFHDAVQALPMISRTHDLQTPRAPQPKLATLALFWGLGVRLFVGSACRLMSSVGS